MSVIKVSLAMDEANLYDEVNVALELMPNSVNNSSRINSLAVSIIVTIIIIGAFFTLVYAFLLPKHVQKSVLPLSK